MYPPIADAARGLALLLMAAGCRAEPQQTSSEAPTDTPDDSSGPVDSSSLPHTGSTSDTGPATGSTADTGAAATSCLGADSLDLTKFRGQIVIHAGESMTGAPTHAYAEIAISFYERWTEPFEDGSEVAYASAGLDDCSLVYKPSLKYPSYYFEEQGTVNLHLDGAAYPVDAVEPYYGYGYYPYITPVDDWGVGYDELLGASFGVSLSHEGRPVDVPEAVTFPEQRMELLTPTFREQLSTEDVRFTWTPAPAGAASTLTLWLNDLDEDKGLPFDAVCTIEDDGEWEPPAHLWEWFDDPIIIWGHLRRETACHVPLGDDGEYLKVATLQDVSMSFIPTRPTSTPSPP